MGRARICRLVLRSVVHCVPEHRRFFLTTRGTEDEQSADRSAVALLLQRFLRPRSDSARQPRVNKRSRWATRRFRLFAAVQPPQRGRLKSLSSFWQFRGEYGFGLGFAECFQFLANRLIGRGQNRRREKRSVFRAGFANRQCTDGNTARHLSGG
jgi:hypothetical protein